MEIIKSYIIALTGFIFLSSIIQAIIPDGSVKQTVKMVLGTMLTMLIVFPFTSSKIENVDIFQNSQAYTIYSDRINDMEKLTNTQRKNLIKTSIHDAVLEIIAQNGTNESIDVEVILTDDNNVDHITIHKNLPALKNKIADQLGISDDKIQMKE